MLNQIKTHAATCFYSPQENLLRGPKAPEAAGQVPQVQPPEAGDAARLPLPPRAAQQGDPWEGGVHKTRPGEGLAASLQGGTRVLLADGGAALHVHHRDVPVLLAPAAPVAAERDVPEEGGRSSQWVDPLLMFRSFHMNIDIYPIKENVTFLRIHNVSNVFVFLSFSVPSWRENCMEPLDSDDPNSIPEVRRHWTSTLTPISHHLTVVPHSWIFKFSPGAGWQRIPEAPPEARVGWEEAETVCNTHNTIFFLSPMSHYNMHHPCALLVP